MTSPVKLVAEGLAGRLTAPVVDNFSDDRPAGTVTGTTGAGGAVRLGCDAERQIAIDHGALRFQPLITPGWGRQGIAYGPFRRASGLVLIVSITNGHNTSQGGPIPESIAKRLWRWVAGPKADPLAFRLAAWMRGPRTKGTIRRFLWWLRSTPIMYKSPNFNENLAIGWFTSAAPKDPLVDGCGFIVHAAEGENGELWARVGHRCLSAFRGLKNLQIYYVVALRERGATYYAAGSAGAHGLGEIPMMRPIAVDPFSSDDTLYAGIHQCALGQIGFRVDTRVHCVHVERIPKFASRFSTAHAGDRMMGEPTLEDSSGLRGEWRSLQGSLTCDETGTTACKGPALAILDPGAPSGLIHALVDLLDSAGIAGLVLRVHDASNFWLLKCSGEGFSLVKVKDGVEVRVADDRRCRLKPNVTHSIQILDADSQLGFYLDGEQIFNACFEDASLEDATGVGVWFGGCGQVTMRDFEAHPREVAMPTGTYPEIPWRRLGQGIQFADGFAGPPSDLATRVSESSGDAWEKTLGSGFLDVDGLGAAKVRATVTEPNPGRTFYTIPWRRPDFADLDVTITPPGNGRGQKQSCRSGLVFWQDKNNYISFTTYLDDDYEGASIALFTKRHGFEELYDAIWTMIGSKVYWGTPFRLRVSFEGNHFIVFVDDEPIMERGLKDIYPEDPPLRIHRVGLAVNWEWGNDTGSTFEEFVARR